MRYRVLSGFVLGPGRIARPGDVIELEGKTVRLNGISFTSGPFIHPSLIQPISDEAAPSASPPNANTVRDVEPMNRDPQPQNRDPRPSRRRARTGEQ